MRVNTILREPLLHFFVLGAGLFLAFAWKNDGELEGPDEIIVDASRVEALKTQFERTWQRPPTADEISGLVESWVREEILYREGVALGLDREDPVLRRRVAQKMEFISEDLLDVAPTGQEVATWFADNAENYRVEPRLSFRQLYFDPSEHGGGLDAVVDQALAALADGDVPDSDASLLPGVLGDASLAEIRRTFGQQFADSLLDQPVGEWTGPVISGYGAHVVRIDDRQESRLPELDEVRAAVERDFRAARTRQAKNALYEKLRERYTVTFEVDLTVADDRRVPDSVQ